MPSPLLEGRDLSVTYGGVRAVSSVDLVVHPGEIVGVIGPNGAGKTSLMDGITGFAPLAGSLSLNGESIIGLRAHERRRRGVSRTWQQVAIFDDLTVAENVAIGLARSDSAQAEEILSRLRLGAYAHRLPGELSHGQRVLAGVARASVGNPPLILMDEPAAGLDAFERQSLIGVMRDTAAAGSAVILIDHDMDVVFEACHRIYVLNFGELIATGTPDEVRQDPAVIAAYLGMEAH